MHYRLIKRKANENAKHPYRSFIEFINVAHELLVDTASHISQQRINNMYCHTQDRGSAPKVAPTISVAPLVDPKSLVDHVALAKAVQQTSSRS
ncbi:predicted protein [Lichtheimia corymbifera JMRC:FSU:9682]|uniref:Uncharacterized protein n=1 Tax=Lichtheimia corymbifera JMRC:FSU:9682 TaxID=1263082 RepID=A0A068SCD3_9FUNG|nr:predicted protein [Lichtheimia corymbifera JMRC:FSU:9682]